MRNLFDQYDQPENRLTYVLASRMENDRGLQRRFLKWLGIAIIQPGTISLSEELSELNKTTPPEVVD